jgi:hypothetical protein
MTATNPQPWGVSHGKPLVLITLVCSRKEGRQQSSSRRGLRPLDDLMRMMMMMMIFYGGTGTKCTEHKIVTRNKDRNNDDGQQRKTNITTNNNTNDRTTVKMTPGAPCDTVRCVHWQKKKTDERRKDDEDEDIDDDVTIAKDESKQGTRMRKTRSDGHGDDLHQGRMEDDEYGGTPMPSATGTLDRKTSQVSPTTCFQPSTLTNETRPTTPDKRWLQRP